MCIRDRDVLTRQGLVTPDLVPVVGREKYFSLPDEVFYLNLGSAAIAVYAFLLYRENRKTYQCTLSYKAIGYAIGASNNTVRKMCIRDSPGKALIPTHIQKFQIDMADLQLSQFHHGICAGLSVILCN